LWCGCRNEVITSGSFAIIRVSVSVVGGISLHLPPSSRRRRSSLVAPGLVREPTIACGDHLSPHRSNVSPNYLSKFYILLFLVSLCSCFQVEILCLFMCKRHVEPLSGTLNKRFVFT
jgi:hypothetical protein